jgi:hypothetical protein
VDILQARGAKYLITTTPELKGRSFGTNVMEAVLVALLGKRLDQIRVDDYYRVLEKVDFKPRCINLEKLNIAL